MSTACPPTSTGSRTRRALEPVPPASIASDAVDSTIDSAPSLARAPTPTRPPPNSDVPPDAALLHPAPPARAVRPAGEPCCASAHGPRQPHRTRESLRDARAGARRADGGGGVRGRQGLLPLRRQVPLRGRAGERHLRHPREAPGQEAQG